MMNYLYQDYLYRSTVKFTLNESETKPCNLERTPKFLVPLKKHTAPQGYECYMSCAVRGDPTPHITWLRNNISLNTNTNYLISNTCGVCSLLVLRVGPKDSGEYKVIAENRLGRAECSTNLSVKGRRDAGLGVVGSNSRVVFLQPLFVGLYFVTVLWRVGFVGL